MTSRGEPNEPPLPLAVFRRCSITFEAAGLSMSENTCKSIKADARTRTGDPFITSEVLYQLSYVGVSRGFRIARLPSPLSVCAGAANPGRPLLWASVADARRSR